MCLQAGMDGFLAKPFRAEELFATLEQMVSHDAIPADRPEVTEESDQPSVFNREDGLARVEGMLDVLAEMAGLFIGELPPLVEAITDALNREDLDPVAKASHRIKGSSGLLGAAAVFAASQDLNDVAKAGDFQGAVGAWSKLQIELTRLEPELQKLMLDAGVPSTHG